MGLSCHFTGLFLLPKRFQNQQVFISHFERRLGRYQHFSYANLVFSHIQSLGHHSDLWTDNGRATFLIVSTMGKVRAGIVSIFA